MKIGFRIIGVLICCVMLLLIRTFEDRLFYDPLLDFFKADYKILPLPAMDVISLTLGIVFRYFLNALFSLAILWLVFLDTDVLKLSIILYLGLLVLFLITFLFLVHFFKDNHYMLILFYVRRFLIQPIFLLLLLPSFYFHKRKSG